MSLFRSASSSPDLNQPPASTHRHASSAQRPQDSTLEGCTTTLKLLIKLVQDHEASIRDHGDDDRSMNRVTGMINILDEVRSRLHKSQSSYGNHKTAHLRRCNTDLRPRRSPDPIPDDRSRSKAAKKSLEIMCSSLGKEKEIMAVELSKKVHELNEMEEHINDLKTQNSMLLEKLQSCGSASADPPNKDKRHSSGGAEAQPGHAALLERNKLLSEQLLKVLEGYRSLKRKMKETQDEKATMAAKMEGLGKDVGEALERVRGLKKRLDARDGHVDVDVDGEVLALQALLESLEFRVLNHEPRRRAPKPSS